MSLKMILVTIEHFSHVLYRMKAEQLLRLYNRITETFAEEFDMSMSGVGQKMFHKKYDMMLYQLMLYLMCTQLTTTPMLITLRKYNGHSLYYCSRGICSGDRVLPLSSIQHNAIKNLMDEHPDRIYLFSPCKTLPSELSPADRKRIINHFNRLLKIFNSDLKPNMYRDKDLSYYITMVLLFTATNCNQGRITIST